MWRDGALNNTLAQKSHDYRKAIIFKKLHFQNVFCLHEYEKPAFSLFSRLKSALEKFRFRDGLVWTADQTVEIKLVFQISLRSVDEAKLSVLSHELEALIR